MFTISHTNTEKTPYIRHKSYENLFVLPYINCRLVFAELAAKAISKGGFDTVVVDLPSFLQDNRCFDTIVNSFPLLTSMIVITSDNEFRSFNFVPNDAACTSAYMVNKLRLSGEEINVEFVDDFNVVNYAKEYFDFPDLTLLDDYFAAADGVEEYFSNTYQEMDKLWCDFSDEQKFFWTYRANTIAERLERSLKKGGKTLFVCNYLLWWLVNKKLIEEDFKQKHLPFWPGKEQIAALVFQNPYFLWIKGALDDYPAIVFRFFTAMNKGNFESFNKIKVLDEIIQECLGTEKDGDDRHLSIRRLRTFRKYLLARLAIKRKMTPTLTTELYDAARSCMGDSFARKMAEKLLEYPLADDVFSLSIAIRNHDVHLSDLKFDTPDEFEQFFINPNSASVKYFLYKLGDSEEKRKKLVSLVRPFITKHELHNLKGIPGTTWALKKEYVFHNQFNKVIRQVVQNRSHESKTLRSWGSIGNGIDWKATILSRVIKENAIYIRKLKRNGERVDELNAFTPTIFIFNQDQKNTISRSVYDSNFTRRMIDLGQKDMLKKTFPNPDFVYSIFYTVDEYGYLCEGHINKFSLSSILFLYSSHWMGLERYKRITARPNKYQCRLTPDNDKELEVFHYPDKLVACGIKYAEKVVIVVSDGNWTQSSKLLSFAQRKGVRIHHIPISTFSKKAIKRMIYLHMISTPLKKHPDQETIVDRFVSNIF